MKISVPHWLVIAFGVVGAVGPVLAGEPKLAAVAAGLMALERLWVAVQPMLGSASPQDKP